MNRTEVLAGAAAAAAVEKVVVGGPSVDKMLWKDVDEIDDCSRHPILILVLLSLNRLTFAYQTLLASSSKSTQGQSPRLESASTLKGLQSIRCRNQECK